MVDWVVRDEQRNATQHNMTHDGKIMQCELRELWEGDELGIIGFC